MLALFEAEFPPQQADRALERLAADWEVDAAVADQARALVVGVAMGQGHHPQPTALELPEDAAPLPARGRVDEHVLHQVGVDQVAGVPAQLPDAVGDLPHRTESRQ